MSAVTFTTDQVIKGISNCSNTKAFGPDKLSIFHLKNLGLRAIEYREGRGGVFRRLCVGMI